MTLPASANKSLLENLQVDILYLLTSEYSPLCPSTALSLNSRTLLHELGTQYISSLGDSSTKIILQHKESSILRDGSPKDHQRANGAWGIHAFATEGFGRQNVWYCFCCDRIHHPYDWKPRKKQTSTCTIFARILCRSGTNPFENGEETSVYCSYYKDARPPSHHHPAFTMAQVQLVVELQPHRTSRRRRSACAPVAELARD